MNRLPRNARKRTVQIKRYEKQVQQGHPIQVGVKFLIFQSQDKKNDGFDIRQWTMQPGYAP